MDTINFFLYFPKFSVSGGFHDILIFFFSALRSKKDYDTLKFFTASEIAKMQ